MKYMKRRGLKLFALAALLPMMAVPGAVAQSAKTSAPAVAAMSTHDQATVKEVEALVRNFLANVPKNDPKVFQEFFADDVIYTRSAGVTVDKAEILNNIGVRAAN